VLFIRRFIIVKHLFAIVVVVLGVFMMGSCQEPEKTKLTEAQITNIKAEVKQAAIDHLNAKDAVTALNNYTEDVLAASNEKLYSSPNVLAEDIKAYYSILKYVDFAAWDDVHINVLDANTALFTAKFRYCFTSTNNEKHALQGVWTALFVRRNGNWKIRLRHESFVPLDE